jgi:nickel transport protein
MKKTIILGLTIALICLTGISSAHFTMIFPSDSEDSAWDITPEDYIAELGDTKTIYVMWGHPYEHISFDMSNVPEISVTKPDGTVEVLIPEEVMMDSMDEEGNMGTFLSYKASFTVDQYGDTVVSVKYEDADEDMIDYTKAVIHCGEEMWFGWDSMVDQQTEIIPYMRPYGMEEGFVFAGKALYNGEPLAGADVEVEIYHDLEAGIEIVEQAEELFPYDAPMVFTRLTRSNADGEFMYTLDEPGIWFVGATMEPEEGQSVRGVFIIPVLEEFPAEETEVAVSEEPEAEEEEEEEEATPSTPGFESVFAVAGLLAALFIAGRKL